MNYKKLSKQFSLNEVLLLFLAFCLFLTAGLVNQRSDKPAISLSKQDTAINLNGNILLYLNLGNKRLLANLLWIQTLLESDEKHYKKRVI